MLKKTKKLIIFSSLLLTILGFTSCSFENKGEEELLKEKVVQELEYLDTKIISMLNGLNNINFENYAVTSKEVKIDESNKEESETADSTENPSSRTESIGNTINASRMEPDTILTKDTNNIDWMTLKNEIELLNSSWDVIILDLYSLKLSNEEILRFSTVLDKCIINIRDEKKVESLTSLAELYGFIPQYLSKIPEENSRKNVKQAKAYILNSYALTEQNAWIEIAKNVQEADNMYKTIMSDIEYIVDKEYRINQTYILLKELEQSVTSKDQKLFYIKYKNVMESLNNL